MARQSAVTLVSREERLCEKRVSILFWLRLLGLESLGLDEDSGFIIGPLFGAGTSHYAPRAQFVRRDIHSFALTPSHLFVRVGECQSCLSRV